jgi:hypothetical protein
MTRTVLSSSIQSSSRSVEEDALRSIFPFDVSPHRQPLVDPTGPVTRDVRRSFHTASTHSGL